MDVTENTRLYRDLEEREASSAVDRSNIIGIFIWEAEGRILEANDAFLHMVGYDRKDLVSGQLRWTDLAPAEWRERDERALAERNSTGKLQPYEKEYFRKDGSRVPALMGAANFEEGGNQGVAFVLDLTERKNAEWNGPSTAPQRSLFGRSTEAEPQRLRPTMRQRFSMGRRRLTAFGGLIRAGFPSREAVAATDPPDDRDRMHAEVQRALGEKRGYSIEYKIVLPDGTVKHVESIGEPEFSASGELVETVCYTD